MKRVIKVLSFILIMSVLVFSYCVFALPVSESSFYTIACNPGEDSATSMGIVWHTNVENTNSYLLYTKKSDLSWQNQIKVEPTVTYDATFKDSLNAIGDEYNRNTVNLTSLEPDTEYMYKITDDVKESKVHYFKTSGSEFSFVWISDFHAYYDDARRLNNAQAVINDCINKSNGVDFVLSTGDNIAHGGTYSWWRQVASSQFMNDYMFATVLGNHDWMTKAGTTVSDGASSKFMSSCMNNPKNGYDNQENVCYYFYYGDALFICLNTEEYTTAQKNWVIDVLERTKGTSQYIFMVQHYQAFNKSGAKNSAGYTRWHEVCDKYGVDIFFTGNSHVYVRSKSIYEDKVSTDPSKGTVYMVAPSSDGDRGESFSSFTSNPDLLEKGWAGGTYQVAASLVTVTKDGIVTKLVNKGGEVIDSATIKAKRPQTSRSYYQLDGVDKSAIEKDFSVQLNTVAINSPKIKLPNNFSDYIRSIEVINNLTNEVYFDGVIASTTKYLELPSVEKGNIEFKLKLTYYDNEEREVILKLNNNYKWGSISKEQIIKEDNNYYLKWTENVNASKLSIIEIYVNNEKYQEISIGTLRCDLPYVSEKMNDVKLIVRDIDGDIVYEQEFKYGEEKKKYTITYIGINDKVLKEEQVEEGKDAPSFVPNEEKGYVFIGWDNELKNITSDTIVHGIYKKVFEVIFVDIEGNILQKQYVTEGENAPLPDAPLVPGYVFGSWEDATNIQSDKTIKPIYNKVYTVIFVDEKGNTLDTQTVVEGQSALAPKVNVDEKYEIFWDKSFTNVTSDLTVKLVLKEKVNIYTVTFIGNNGEVILKVEVEEGSAATAPIVPEISGLKFVKWDVDFSNISSDLEVHAVYQKVGGCAAANYVFMLIQLMFITSLFFTRKRC